MTSADGLRDGDAEFGEAVQDGDADLEFGGLTVEVAGGELMTEELQAVHLGLDAASAMVARPLAPERPPEARHGAQVVVASLGVRALLLPRLCVPARRNDRFRAAVGDGIAAGAPIVGPVGGHGCDLLIRGNLRQQAGQHGRVVHAAVGDLDSSDLERALVDSEVHLAPHAALGSAMLARMPFAFAANLNACAVDQKVQRAGRAPAGKLYRQRLLTAARAP